MPASLMSETSITYANRVDPWHKMGVPMNAEGMTALEALDLAKLRYKVHKIAPILPMPDGTLWNAGTYSILMREPVPAHKHFDWEEIGTCTNQYHLLQNEDIAQILDDSGITKEWKVITMGALGRGDRFFVTLAAGRYSIAGEDVEGFVSILDDKAGKAALRIVESETIVVCTNTYQLADASARMSASIPHNSKIRQDFEWKATLFRQVMESQQSFKQLAERFAKQKVTSAEVGAVVEWALPMPEAPKAVELRKDAMIDKEHDLTNMVAKELLGHTVEQVKKVGGDPIARFERERVRTIAMRDAVIAEYGLTCQERPKIAGTRWALFNAFTGAIDHAPRAGRSVAPEIRAQQATLGPEAAMKVDVFNVLSKSDDLMELATASRVRPGYANRVIEAE